MDLRGSAVPYELVQSPSQRRSLRSFGNRHDAAEAHRWQSNSDGGISRTASHDQLIRSEDAKPAINCTSTPVLEAAHHDEPGSERLRNTETIPRTWSTAGRLWSREILACILGATAISALVATLYVHQGRPLPEWPFKISVNTVISVYSVVLKSSIGVVVSSCIGQLQWLWFRDSRSLYDAVRYDEASRGPWGSVKLLGPQSISRPVTTFAAIVSILTIAVDPFFQQIIRYSDCQVPMPAINATILRSSYFDRDHVFQTNMSFNLNQPLTASLSAGVFGAPRSVSSSCLTGNCTFSTFSTIGFCSSCEDISETIVTNTTCSNETEGCEDTYGRIYNSALPSGLAVEWGLPDNGLTAFTGSFSADTYNFEFLAPRTFFSDNKIDPLTGKNLTGECANAPPSDWRCRGYGAASCRIYPCAKTFNTSIAAGKTSELLISQTSIDDIQTPEQSAVGTPAVWIKASCLTSEELEAVKGQVRRNDGTWLTYNTTAEMESQMIRWEPNNSLPQILNLSDSMFERQCVYTCDGLLVTTLSEWIPDNAFLVGNVEFGLLGSDKIGGVRVYRMDGITGQGQLQLLHNSGNLSFGLIQETFNDIADTVTLHMRENGIENYADPALGVVYHYATCLDVNWPWISLPVALGLGALLLLLITGNLMARGGIPVWKSSLLPYMYRTRLDEVGSGLKNRPEETGDGTPNDALGSMEEAAKATRVIIDRSAQGMKLLKIE